jgi:Polysaccharide lyase family 4, domain III
MLKPRKSNPSVRIMPERYVVSSYEQFDGLCANQWRSSRSVSRFRLLSLIGLAPNFSLDKYLFHRSLGDAPGSRQPPFGVGISIFDPMYPVNDATIYRDADQSGYYHQLPISFPASLLKVGSNTITFTMTKVNSGGGIMYDTIKLEAD